MNIRKYLRNERSSYVEINKCQKPRHTKNILNKKKAISQRVTENPNTNINMKNA